MNLTRSLRPIVRRTAALTLVVVSGQASALQQTVYEFDILRNGSQVGKHELQISQADTETQVLALSNIEVTFLGFTVYQMRYRAEEVWDADGLKALTVNVDDDGQSRRIDGQRRGTQFHWLTSDGSERSAPLPVYPSNHWNPGVLNASRVLNTLTGQSNRIEVVTDPEESALPLPQTGADMPRAYAYRGELNLHSWYDRKGRWLGMRFKGRDGSDIEYVYRSQADIAVLGVVP